MLEVLLKANVRITREAWHAALAELASRLPLKTIKRNQGRKPKAIQCVEMMLNAGVDIRYSTRWGALDTAHDLEKLGFQVIPATISQGATVHEVVTSEAAAARAEATASNAAAARREQTRRDRKPPPAAMRKFCCG